MILGNYTWSYIYPCRGQYKIPKFIGMLTLWSMIKKLILVVHFVQTVITHCKMDIILNSHFASFNKALPWHNNEGPAGLKNVRGWPVWNASLIGEGAFWLRGSVLTATGVSEFLGSYILIFWSLHTVASLVPSMFQSQPNICTEMQNKLEQCWLSKTFMYAAKSLP